MIHISSSRDPCAAVEKPEICCSGQNTTISLVFHAETHSALFCLLSSVARLRVTSSVFALLVEAGRTLGEETSDELLQQTTKSLVFHNKSGTLSWLVLWMSYTTYLDTVYVRFNNDKMIWDMMTFTLPCVLWMLVGVGRLCVSWVCVESVGGTHTVLGAVLNVLMWTHCPTNWGPVAGGVWAPGPGNQGDTAHLPQQQSIPRARHSSAVADRAGKRSLKFHCQCEGP